MKSMLSVLSSDLNITLGSGYFSKKASECKKCKKLGEEWSDGQAPQKVFKIENPKPLLLSLLGKILRNSQC